MYLKVLSGTFALFLLAGCAHEPPPEPLIIYRPTEVKVPVPVKRECPAQVCHKFKASCPLPVFMVAKDSPTTATLSPEEQKRLRCLLLDLHKWGSGMLVFTLAP